MSDTPNRPGERDEDDAISDRYADLVVDALLRAGIVAPDHFERARAIIAEEILVRRSMGDK
jgi:hypothetical protein